MGNYVFHMSEHVEFIFLEVETINKFLIKMGTKKKELIFEQEKKKIRKRGLRFKNSFSQREKKKSIRTKGTGNILCSNVDPGGKIFQIKTEKSQRNCQ